MLYAFTEWGHTYVVTNIMLKLITDSLTGGVSLEAAHLRILSLALFYFLFTLMTPQLLLGTLIFTCICMTFKFTLMCTIFNNMSAVIDATWPSHMN